MDPSRYQRVEYEGFEFEIYECEETGKWIAVLMKAAPGFEMRRGEQWVRPDRRKLRHAIRAWSIWMGLQKPRKNGP